MSTEIIPVTQPFLPPKEEFDALVNEIWDRNWLTNNGPLVKQLEASLKAYLDLSHLLFVTNGTIALQLAIKALHLKGEIITTPFSYVATTSSIAWEGCTPVFVDIDPVTFNIDPSKIAAAITPQTSAIMATHVYGNPCDIDRIQAIADQYGLKVIYDAAHAFGSLYHNQSALQFGDISTTSFHATKLYHSIEGGAVICRNPEMNFSLSRLRNFGHTGYYTFDGLGINGKNSEFHAAMGVANLKYVPQILAKRKMDVAMYRANLDALPFQFQEITARAEGNDSYFPILCPSESYCAGLVKHLEKHSIMTRRYFYPLLNTLNYVPRIHELPVAEDVSRRILCLPLFYGLSQQNIEKIAKEIQAFHQKFQP